MKERAFDQLDCKAVRLYQAVVFGGYLVSAVQSIALGSPPTAVAQTMGPAVAMVWIALLIGCPLLSALGWRRRERPGGVWLLTAGDSGAACATAAYVVAVLQTTWAERATFAAWNATSLTVCAVLILSRDLWRLREMTRRVSRTMREVNDRERDRYGPGHIRWRIHGRWLGYRGYRGAPRPEVEGSGLREDRRRDEPDGVHDVPEDRR